MWFYRILCNSVLLYCFSPHGTQKKLQYFMARGLSRQPACGSGRLWAASSGHREPFEALWWGCSDLMIWKEVHVTALCHSVFLWGINEEIHVKPLLQCLDYQTPSVVAIISPFLLPFGPHRASLFLTLQERPFEMLGSLKVILLSWI